MDDAWINARFSGHGVAVRREADDAIPGEPFMSMAIAKDIVRAAIELARSEGRKAADTALSERVAELERGLEPFAAMAGKPLKITAIEGRSLSVSIDTRHFDKARALLHPSEGEAGT